MKPETCCGRIRYECDSGESLSWPDPRDPMEIQWKLRYGNPTTVDLFAAASIIDAYGCLFGLDVRTRNKRMSEIKAAISETPNPPEHSRGHPERQEQSNETN